jgi:hypothetical protein
MPPRPRDRVVEKRVFFYEVHVNGGRVRRADDFDFPRLMRAIGSLPYSEDARYEPDEDDSVVSCFVDTPTNVRFGRIRRSNLPSIADGANLTNLNVAPEAGLFECSHVVYCAMGILGAEFNNYAPRISSRLASYIQRIADFDGRIEILPIARGTPLQAFRRMRDLRALTIKVATSEAAQLREAGGGLIANLTRAARDVDFLEFTLSLERGGGALGNEIVQSIASLLAMPNVRESVEKLAVRGYVQGKSTLDTVDLLRDELVVSKQFLRESLRSKTLDTEDAYQKVVEAYDEIREMIRR